MKKRAISLAMCAAMTAGALFGGQTIAFAEESEPVSLRIVMYGEAGERNSSFFKNEFHEKVLEDLNIDMTVEWVGWGEQSKLMTMAASGEGFAYMSTVTESPDLLSAGLYTTFTQEMFDELAPHYIESRMGRGFDCAKYKGEIITIPCGAATNSAKDHNLGIRNDILNQVGWDVSQITDYDTLMEAIAAVREAYPDLRIINGVGQLYKALHDYLDTEGVLFKSGSTAVCIVDESKPESDEVISNLESDYFKKYCKMMKEWMDLGYITTEDLTDSTIASTAWNSGNCLMAFSGPGTIYNHELIGSGIEDADVQFLRINTTQELLYEDSNSAWLITKADQDKAEDWVRFFDWMYASKENYMMCLYGKEGTDWQYREDGTVETLTQDQFFYTWMHSTFLYEAPSAEVYDAEEVDRYMHYDDEALYSKTIGFVFDKTPVESQAARITTIISEKVTPLTYGIGNFDEDYPAILEELKAAGLDEYVAEYQKQFSEFMANK